MEIIKEEPVPAAEARNSLRKRDPENLNYEQKICNDFLRQHVKLPVTKARKLVKELLEVGRMKPHQAVTIVNILPESKDDIRLIFAKERTTLKEEEMEEILRIVGKYGK